VGLLAALGASCGIGVERDLSTLTPAAVVFDDACGLQSYWDDLATTRLSPPAVVFSQDLEKPSENRPRGGRTRFLFETEFQLHHLRRLLAQNWKRVPEEVAKASAVAVQVRWSERAGTRRVVTTEDAELWVGRESWSLPYHACLSDFLFGGALYKTRRELLNLPPPPPSPWVKYDGGADASAAGGPASPDAGVDNDVRPGVQ
jgi:hypothetical protein